MKVLVVGGTRFIGREVVRELEASGHDVTVVHRGETGQVPGGASEIRADRSTAYALEAMKRLAPDALVDMCAYVPGHTRELLDALPDVPRWVHCSTGAVYRPSADIPWAEDHPVGPWLWGRYGQDKLECELLLKSRRSERRTTVVVRPPYVLGPGNYVAREEFVFNRILDGQPVFIDGDGEAPLSMIDVRDIGRLFCRAATSALPDGRIPVNAATATQCSGREFVRLCSQVAEREVLTVSVASTTTGETFDRDDHVFPFPDFPYVLSGDKARELGLLGDPRPLSDTLESSLSWLMEHPERRSWHPGTKESRLREGRSFSE